MSLDNIQLPGFIIQDLYRKTLVDIGEHKALKEVNKSEEIKFLGGNNKQITLLIKNIEGEFLNDPELTFLTGILNACKLNMQDVALVNLNNHSTITYKKITEILHSKIILLFGISADTIQLPFIIPQFQKQAYNNQTYLSIPSLEELENDKDLKRQFWNILKQIFSL